MPLVTTKPIGQQNGDILTQFTDTTSTASVTYTFPTQQTKLVIENSGEKDIFVTVGSYTGQIIKADKKWQVDVSFTSFSIRSDVNSQEFIATAILKSGEDLASLTSQLAEATREIAETSSTKNIRIVSLIACQDDETPINGGSLNTTEVDTVNYKINGRGWKVNVAGVGHQVDFIPSSVPLSLPPSSALGLWVYIPDSTKLTGVRVTLYHNAALTELSLFSDAAQPIPKNGWNLFRWSAVAPSNNPNMQSIHRIRVHGSSTAATSYTIGQVWVECPKKAQILFIHDGGYSEFYNSGYSDLKARNIPVTWALIPGLIGQPEYMTQIQVDEVARENKNSMSFHSWAAEVGTSMTDADIRAQTMKCLKYLRQHGYTGGMWRAAFYQNTAPTHAAIKNMVLAYRRWESVTDQITCYPFPTMISANRYKVPGITLQAYNSNPTGLEGFFAELKTYNGLMVCYTHTVNSAGGPDITPERWAHFLTLIDQGVSEGWLEGVTYEQLFARSGGKIRQGIDGSTFAEYYNEDGNIQKMILP